MRSGELGTSHQFVVASGLRPELLTALQAISEGVTLLRAGNPNHKPSGPGGGQFTGAGGTNGSGKGKHSRRRRKAKAKREANSMRRRHRAERKNLLSDQRREHGRVKREHQNELAGHSKTVSGERSKLLASQHSERETLLKHDPDENKRQGAAKVKESLGKLRGEQKAARSELVASQSKRLADIKKSHATELAELKAEHREYRKDARDDQRKEKRLFIDELRGERRSYEVLFWSDDSRHSRRLDGGASGRFSVGKTHKANSAEAILRHVLRQRGWTRLYGEDGLTGRQHLSLLDDVRQYGRQWMRHEAESFFDRYGVDIEERSLVSVRSPDWSGDQGMLSGIERGADEGDVLANPGRNGLESQRYREPITRGIAARAQGALSRFFRRTKGFMQELIVAGAMALKGEEPLTHAEVYALDRLTKKQYDYLDKFEREVTANPPREISDFSTVTIFAEPAPMTSGQFTARAESYGNAPWEVQNVGRDIVRQQAVFSAERRVHKLSFAEHRPCKGCLDESQKAWQPMGTLREIGDCECMSNCDCYFEWADKDSKVHVSPWGRHNPRGYNIPGQPGTQLPGIGYPVDQPAIPAVPSGPGPAEKLKPKKIKLKPPQKVGEPYPKGGEYPPARPLQSVEDLLKEAGSPYAANEYEEA